jgi:hypothetical protein
MHMGTQNKLTVPKKMQCLFEEIGGATDAFCRGHLTEEYALICRKLTAALCRKRPSPLLRGKPHTWAAGIVHTAGWLNFLFDPTDEPHMTARELGEQFGVSSSTLSTKKRIIQTALRIVPLDPNYTLPSLLEENPLAWMIEVDGFVMDVRTAPYEIQEAAYGQGLIPYVPDDEDPGINESAEMPTIIKFPEPHDKRPDQASAAYGQDQEPNLFPDLEE